VSYYFTTKIDKLNFEQTVEKVTEVLKEHGFGVVTEIDVKATLKKKIDVDFRNYIILGACHPQYAYQALSKEEKIGVFLPCNVVVDEKLEGGIEVTAVDPIASMMAVDNPGLAEFGQKVQAELTSVIDKLQGL